MTIQQLIERLIAISVIDPDAKIKIETDDSYTGVAVETVFYSPSRRCFLINGDDET